MNIPELPKNIEQILIKYNSPERLNRHLRIVFFIASQLLFQLEKEWKELEIDNKLVQFGAVTHDIGKVLSQAEIYHSGNKHEFNGRDLLISYGYDEVSSRFTITHGNWQKENIELEDLIVALADKIWKGKRVSELEEMICSKISNQLKIDYWEIYLNLNSILDKLCLSAQSRLNWQNEVE